MKRFFQVAFISLGMVGALQHVNAVSNVAADTIFYGSPILTVNAKNAEVEALAVQNGKIVAVGKKVLL